MSKYNLENSSRKKIIVILVFVVILVIFAYILEKKQALNIFGEKSVSSTIPSESPNESPAPSTDTSPQTPTNKTESPQQDKIIPTSNDGDLAAPSGTFISTHNITLNDPIYNNLESVCVTTPGATCSIVFKKGDISKTLEAKTTDSNGSVTWNWNPNDAGLSTGSWQIIATATSGSKTKSTTDLQNLEVNE